MCIAQYRAEEFTWAVRDHDLTETMADPDSQKISLMLLFAGLGWHFNRPIPDSSSYPLGDIHQLFLLATLEWQHGSLIHHPHNSFQSLSFYGMGESLFFSKPIETGTAEIVGGTIENPTKSGCYLLEYGLVHEGINWRSRASIGVTVGG